MKGIIVCGVILTLFAFSIFGFVALSGGPVKAPVSRPPFIPILSSGTFFILSGILMGVFLVSGAAAALFLVRAKVFENIRLKGPNWVIVSLIVRLLIIFLVIYFLAAFVLSFLSFDEEKNDDGRMPSEGEVVEAEPPPEEAFADDESINRPDGVGPRRSFITALILAVMAGVLVFLYRYYRTMPRSGPREVENLHEEMRRDLMTASVKSLEGMLSTLDHRKAIITAYAIMEESFAKYGFRRKPHQTPKEYMERTIQDVGRNGGDLPEPLLLELTDLYETAKFSDHEIVLFHRESAMTCLRDIQSSLSERGKSSHA